MRTQNKSCSHKCNPKRKRNERKQSHKKKRPNHRVKQRTNEQFKDLPNIAFSKNPASSIIMWIHQGMTFLLVGLATQVQLRCTLVCMWMWWTRPAPAATCKLRFNQGRPQSFCFRYSVIASVVQLQSGRLTLWIENWMRDVFFWLIVILAIARRM